MRKLLTLIASLAIALGTLGAVAGSATAVAPIGIPVPGVLHPDADTGGFVAIQPPCYVVVAGHTYVTTTSAGQFDSAGHATNLACQFNEYMSGLTFALPTCVLGSTVLPYKVRINSSLVCQSTPF